MKDTFVRHLKLKLTLGLMLAAQAAVAGFAPLTAEARTEKPAPQYLVRKAWNFTPSDYTKLKALGRDLRFSERSQWLPIELQESLMGVLKFTLDESLAPSSTAGINRMDFYHGHLNCVSFNVRLQELGRKIESNKTEAFEAVGLKWFEMPTKKTYKAWAPIIDRLDAANGELLREMIRNGDCDNALVQYHTFEYNNAEHGVAVNDMRRHLSMRLGDRSNSVLRETEKPQPSIFEFKIDLLEAEKPVSYFNMFNFGFLIDREGVIHVTEGSQLGLHRFTGVQD